MKRKRWQSFKAPLLCWFLFHSTSLIFAQKPNVDSNCYTWPVVQNAAISSNGKFVSYNIAGGNDEGGLLVVMNNDNSWKKEIKLKQINQSAFSEDGQRMYFQSGNALGIISLGDTSTKYINNVISFKLIDMGPSEWLAYQKKGTQDSLIIKNLKTNESVAFPAIADYLPAGNGLLLVQAEVQGSYQKSQILKWVNLLSYKATNIWEGNNPTGFIFNKAGSECAFIASKVNGKHEESEYWFFNAETKNAVKICDNSSFGEDTSLTLGEIDRFSNDGGRIFFKIKKNYTPKLNPNFASVDIWSYRDKKLQSEQLSELGPKGYAAVINIADGKIIRLEQNRNEIGFFNPSSNDTDDQWCLIRRVDGDISEWNWNYSSEESIYLVSTKFNTRKLITKNVSPWEAISFTFSPKKKYIIFFSAKNRNYMSYKISTGEVRNITHGIQANWITNGQDDAPQSRFRSIGCAGWLKDESAVLIYDKHDIFQVDPSGKHSPISLTNYYGNKKNIVFRLGLDYGKNVVFDSGQRIILKAFNNRNKNDGFYSKEIGKTGDPKYLIMQPYLYEPSDENEFALPAYPLKANNAESYIVQRQSAEESPNLFYTSDFKKFIQLSYIFPEKQYNWLTSELITWKTFNGTLSQGILYKPENFNPKKKYPVIFFYYERFSEGLHQFLKPNFSDALIDIPTFVSDGYLVFVPDIHYPLYTGQGPGCFNSVVSAASYLSKFPWVDSKRMGIQGHSRGGFETDYLITHSNLFAAAMSASGYSDAISLYSARSKPGYEMGSQRIGATLWQRRAIYIQNSPVFRANRVTTPVLMMNNKMDDDIPFSQGIEFFTDLRRLGKKAWMLQYDGEGHVLSERKATIDLSIRMKQFFDYYLKGTSAPKWMVEGIPAEKKGLDDGLSLEPKGIKPGLGLLINK